MFYLVQLLIFGITGSLVYYGVYYGTPLFIKKGVRLIYAFWFFLWFPVMSLFPVSFRGKYLDMAKYFGSSPKRVVDFRSDWALCCCRFAFAQKKHLLLSLRFRTEQSFLGALLLSLRFRTEKTFVAVASLSHRAELPGGVR
ncbi:hypothetical protein ACIQ7N_02235 [Lysinibacillus sp. NPDC095746]|uniref:hypothetical protein n=1 Tax=Lysinibacillus sp. NPDC095746 TaxID=3364134 RepID=UPI0038224038